MYIQRDITEQLSQSGTWIEVVLGPRQCGKSTLLMAMLKEEYPTKVINPINFDDLQLRRLATQDPALFLQNYLPPLLLDEVQYVPNLFSQLKKLVDERKNELVFNDAHKIVQETLFYLTGSNQILMDKNVKESLVGRASYFYLNTLTVHEILRALPKTSVAEIIFKGGWPELYINSALSPINYINDYIRSYLEKDIVLSAGIQKINEFHTVLGLSAARTGQLLDYSDIAKDSGVRSVTIKEWLSLLERADLIYLLKPYFNNFNKRLIKSPKLYFLDTGLATRLQGWSEVTPLLQGPYAGNIFETLVLAEIVKFIRNYRKPWQLFFWRTKEGDEVDFLLETSKNNYHAFEAKLALQGMPEQILYPRKFQKEFQLKNPLVIITFGGKKLNLSEECVSVPIALLHDYLSGIE